MHTHIPLVHSKNVHQNPLLISIKKYKRTYAGLNIFFSWAEKIVRPNTAPFLLSKHKVIKQHSSTLAIPGWFENTLTLSANLKKVKTAKNRKARWEAIKKVFFSSLIFTNSSISAARALDNTRFIDLTAISHSFPHTMTGISSVVNMTLKTNDLYQKSKKWHLPSSIKELREWLHLNKKKAWSLILVSHTLLGFLNAIVSILIFFFNIVFPFYMLLSISTYMFCVALARDLPD